MCVIMAKKYKSNSSNSSKWFLYKIRDRNYNPIYKLKVKNNKNIETLFLTDHINKWSEGINSNGLMIVSAALDNHSDFEDNTRSSDISSIHKKNKSAMITLNNAIESSNIEEAKKILIDNRFVGTSFISDGDNLIILEIYVKDESYNREIKLLGSKIEKLSKAEQIIEVMKGIKDSDYDIAHQEVKNDITVIRTNHGKLLDKAGYQKKDKDKKGYTSSMFRYKITKEAIEKLDNIHPIEILTILKNLKGIEKESQNNPIRAKVDLDKDGKQPYYSTTIIMLTSTGSMFAVPLEDDIDEDSKLRLKKDRKVNFILLPKNLSLFESFKSITYKNIID